MPQRDEHGKPLSGAAKRKLSRQRRQAYEQARAEAAARGEYVPSPEDFPIRPPPEDTACLLEWGLECLGQLLKEASLDPGLQGVERYRTIGFLGSVAGKIKDGALYQSRVRRLCEAHGIGP